MPRVLDNLSLIKPGKTFSLIQVFVEMPRIYFGRGKNLPCNFGLKSPAFYRINRSTTHVPSHLSARTKKVERDKSK